ncbi:MAG: carotenoid biosynthesis protein [Mycobacteriales bacterium]
MPALLAALTIALEICYPLASGTARDRLTVATVLVFLAASVAHAGRIQGPIWTLRFLVVVVAIAFAVEAIGVRTGVPFGSYAYDGGLGPSVLGVPVLVPLAWAMFAYPALVVGKLLGHWLAAAWALASWDLFLDPQMVHAGHWHFAAGGVPMTNYLGWVLVALVLMAVLTRLPWRAASTGVPVVLFVWTWLGSTLANAAFFGRPAVAVSGFVGMGLVGVPLLRRLRCG